MTDAHALTAGTHVIVHSYGDNARRWMVGRTGRIVKVNRTTVAVAFDNHQDRAQAGDGRTVRLPYYAIRVA